MKSLEVIEVDEMVVKWNGEVNVIHFGSEGKERRLHGHNLFMTVYVELERGYEVEWIGKVMEEMNYKIFVGKDVILERVDDERVRIINNRMEIIVLEDWVIRMDEKRGNLDAILRYMMRKIKEVGIGVRGVKIMADGKYWIKRNWEKDGDKVGFSMMYERW